MIVVMMANVGVVLSADRKQVVSAGNDGNSDKEWSFLDYPAVPRSNLPAQQRSRLRAVGHEHDLNLRDLRCQARLDTLIEIYVETYPRFERLADDAEWRRRWVDAFALTTYVHQLDCLVLNDVLSVIIPEMLQSRGGRYHTPYFCGRYSNNPIAEPVRKAVRQLVELAIEYDSEHAAVRLVSAGRALSGPISLNPDVMFYLAERFAFLSSKGRIVTTVGFMRREFRHRGYELAPERRAEVIAAARRGDAAAILSTTAPCKPYRMKTEQAD